MLKNKGFAEWDESTGRHKMRPIEDFMEPGLASYPNNLLHLFGASLSDFGVEDDEYFRGRKVNFVFALKHVNNGKVNSFKWLFQGLAKYLQPTYVQKLDIGSRPSDYGLAKLYKHLEAVPDCGGCCAEVIIETEGEAANRTWGAWFMTMLQYYEYKQTIAYFKTFEGWGGFVQALPGCYCMYRYEALRGEPLNKFFKLINAQQEPTCWEANEYLVEDRLLANNVYYQTGAGYRTDFVIDAAAYTDAPATVELLMKQRRRWSNGFLFGELTTLMNVHNVLGFNGQTHSILQRMKMLIYVPLLVANKALGWINPALLLSQMKYLLIYSAYAHFDNPTFKAEHEDLWKFFTNDPSSIGFQSVMNLTVLFLVMFAVVAGLGAQISDAMPYYRFLMAWFQGYTFFSAMGTVYMLRNFGLWDAEGHLNIYVAQFALTWLVLLCPFYYKPFDALTNLHKYIPGLIIYYLSYFWWYVIVTIYAFCNLDDVTWGNRPANASKGMNVVVDNAKRQEILRQSYRSTRTNILIWWLVVNILIMFTIDCLVLSAVHNNNIVVKTACQTVIKGYSWWCVGNGLLVLGLSGIHTVIGNARLYICASSYSPASIRKRPPVSNDPETKVLLDDTEEEESHTLPIVHAKKKAASSKKGKSEYETDEDPSFFSDDLESH